MMNDIERLQNNLAIIRKAGGWTLEEFGEFLGLSKQSISNLEHKTVKMSKAQYIAIRAILDYMIEPDNVLYMVVVIFLNADDIPEDTLIKCRTYLSGVHKNEMIFPDVLDGLSAFISSEKICTLMYNDSKSIHWMERIIHQ